MVQCLISFIIVYCSIFKINYNRTMKLRVKGLKSKVFNSKMAIYTIQYTLANPNRGVSIKKKSVPISELVRISEVIHLYGEFCSESL